MSVFSSTTVQLSPSLEPYTVQFFGSLFAQSLAEVIEYAVTVSARFTRKDTQKLFAEKTALVASCPSKRFFLPSACEISAVPFTVLSTTEKGLLGSISSVEPEPLFSSVV